MLHVHVYMHFSTSSWLFWLVYSIRPPRIQLTPAVNLEPMWKTFLTRHTSTKQRENKYNFTLLGFKCHDSNVCSHSPQRKDCVQGLLGKKRSPIGVKDVRMGWRADQGLIPPTPVTAATPVNVRGAGLPWEEGETRANASSNKECICCRASSMVGWGGT